MKMRKRFGMKNLRIYLPEVEHDVKKSMPDNFLL